MVIEEQQPSTEEKKKRPSISRIMVIITIVTVIGGFGYALLAGWGFLPGEPVAIIGFTMLVLSILFLVFACLFIGKISARMPEYGEMENKFKLGMEYYDAEEWEKALSIFKELMGPDMDHKRALYYAARCSEQLERWEDVKTYIKRYVEMQPNDREAWELLAKAHKKFFEYEEAEAAQRRAEQLSPRGR